MIGIVSSESSSRKSEFKRRPFEFITESTWILLAQSLPMSAALFWLLDDWI